MGGGVDTAEGSRKSAATISPAFETRCGRTDLGATDDVPTGIRLDLVQGCRQQSETRISLPQSFGPPVNQPRLTHDAACPTYRFVDKILVGQAATDLSGDVERVGAWEPSGPGARAPGADGSRSVAMSGRVIRASVWSFVRWIRAHVAAGGRAPVARVFAAGGVLAVLPERDPAGAVLESLIARLVGVAAAGLVRAGLRLASEFAGVRRAGLGRGDGVAVVVLAVREVEPFDAGEPIPDRNPVPQHGQT